MTGAERPKLLRSERARESSSRTGERADIARANGASYHRSEVSELPPRVSICVPTWNGAARLGETLESALSQTFADFELIVVDDCSTDETPAVIARYPDPRVRPVRNERR